MGAGVESEAIVTDFNEVIERLRADDSIPKLVGDSIEETLAALPDTIPGNPGEPVVNVSRQETKRLRRAHWAVASIAACALLAAVLVAVPVLSGTDGRQSDDAAVASKSSMLANTFSVEPAYASEFEAGHAAFENASGQNEKKGAIALENGDGGVNGYTRMVVRVIGDNIATVRISIDKGALYWKKTVPCTKEQQKRIYEAYWQMQWMRAIASGNPQNAFEMGDDNVISGSISAVDDNDRTVSYYEKKGSSFEAAYDADARYGLLLPDDVWLAESQREGGWESRLSFPCDYFDGATLTVEVSYLDGSTDQMSYRLQAGNLAYEMRDLDYEVPGFGRGREMVIFDRLAEEGEDSIPGMLAIPVTD